MWNQDTNIHDSWLPNLNPLSPWNNFRLLRNMNDGVKWSWLMIMSNPAKNAGWKVPEFVASADVTTKRLTINQQQLQTVHKMYYYCTVSTMHGRGQRRSPSFYINIEVDIIAIHVISRTDNFHWKNIFIIKKKYFHIWHWWKVFQLFKVCQVVGVLKV